MARIKTLVMVKPSCMRVFDLKLRLRCPTVTLGVALAMQLRVVKYAE